MVVVEDVGFCVIVYSENVFEMLDLMFQVVFSMGEMDVLSIGMDVRILFIFLSVFFFEKVVVLQDISFFNLIIVYCRSFGKLLYVIVYCIDVGIVIDFEVVKMNDVIVLVVGVL